MCLGNDNQLQEKWTMSVDKLKKMVWTLKLSTPSLENSHQNTTNAAKGHVEPTKVFFKRNAAIATVMETF
jgi:hypothetical protein